MKILNLYSGIGGNRKLWGEQHEITAVEFDKEIAMIYKNYFPNDKVLIEDAHEYLLNNYMNYDFIWSSPPCPTHSRMRYTCTKQDQKTRSRLDVKYVDMKLYQEILLLENYFEGKYVVENVIPYYQPLIPAQKLGRHLLWCNFRLGSFKKDYKSIRGNSMAVLQERRGFDLSKFKIKQRKDTILLNCVDSDLGLYVLNCALNVPNKKEGAQTQMF